MHMPLHQAPDSLANSVHRHARACLARHQGCAWPGTGYDTLHVVPGSRSAHRSPPSMPSGSSMPSMPSGPSLSPPPQATPAPRHRMGLLDSCNQNVHFGYHNQNVHLTRTSVPGARRWEFLVWMGDRWTRTFGAIPCWGQSCSEIASTALCDRVHGGQKGELSV